MDLPVESVCAGMIVAQDVYYKGDVKLISKGTVLTEQHIEKLRNHGISYIEITNTQFSDYCMWNKTLVTKPFRISERAPVLSEKELRTVLGNVSVFSGFSQEQISFIIKHSTRTKYAPHTLLFRENDQGDTFLIILRGSVKIFIRNNQGKELVLSVLKVGDSFGELSLIDGQPRSASAATLEETELLHFTRAKFFELLNDNPKLAQGIMVELSRRLRKTNSQIGDLVFHDARYRILKNLILMANRFGKRKGDTIYVKMPLNHDELAQMAAVDRMELNEVIRDLENKRILWMKENSYEIHLNNILC